MLANIRLSWMRWNLRRRIRKYGWSGMFVAGPHAEDDFGYTAGFWESLGQPEVITSGFSRSATNMLLSAAYRDLKSGRLVLSDYRQWEGWDPKLVWRAVHPSQIRREHFGVAIWYREIQGQSREGLAAYQLVTTDTQGCLPWEDGYDLAYRPRQRALYERYTGPPWDDWAISWPPEAGAPRSIDSPAEPAQP